MRVEKEVKKIIPILEKRISYRVVKKISDFLQEEFYPPQSMFREEFLQEVKEARMEARMGKLIDWKELQKSWKKSHEKI